jgi:hypothetical protein
MADLIYCNHVYTCCLLVNIYDRNKSMLEEWK